MLRAAGHVATSNPVFFNHSPERTIYFDSAIEIALTREQRSLIKITSNISHLFDLSDKVFDEKSEATISFYSMELSGAKSTRSQIAHDVHKLFHQSFGCNASIFVFRFHEELMLSLTGFGLDVVLSDWYSFYDIEGLITRIHISNMMINNAKNYFYDFIYSVARWYYIRPIASDTAAVTLLPINYFANSFDPESLHIARDELKEIIRQELVSAENEYQDDYVNQYEIKTSTVDIGAELDMIAFAMELDEETPIPLDEADENLDDVYDEEANTAEKDIYQYGSLSPEVFIDPTLMVKWLEKNEADLLNV